MKTALIKKTSFLYPLKFLGAEYMQEKWIRPSCVGRRAAEWNALNAEAC
jgi:hypothetical protein